MLTRHERSGVLFCDAIFRASRLGCYSTRTARDGFLVPIKTNFEFDEGEDLAPSRSRMSDVCGKPTSHASEAPTREWKCANKECNNTDTNKLEYERNTCSWVCVMCGAVSSTKMVSREREKACCASEDKTTHADRAQLQDDPFSEAPPCAEVRRKRRQAEVGGFVSGRVRKKLSLGSADSKIRRQVAAETRRESVLGEKGSKRAEKVQVYLWTCIEKVPNMHKEVQQYCSRMANAVMTNGARHARACSNPECMINIQKRSGQLIALCTLTACLEKLKSTHGTEHHAISSDCSRQSIIQMMGKAKTLKIKGAGEQQYQQVEGTVKLIMEWDDAQICTPCQDGSDVFSARDSKEESPCFLATDRPSSMQRDVRIATRNSIYAAAQLEGVPTREKQLSLDAVAHPDVLRRAETGDLPVEIFGICLLRACSILLHDACREGCGEDLLARLASMLKKFCAHYAVFASAAEEEVEELKKTVPGEMVKRAVSPAAADIF